MRRSERLGIAVSVVCLGFLYAVNYTLPTRELYVQVVGLDLRLAISGAKQMALLLAAIISLGVDATLRSHPRHAQRSLLYTAAYWPLPALITIGTLLILPGISRWAYQLASILLAGGCLTFTVYLQYMALDDAGQVRRIPRLLLNVAAYVLALICFTYLNGMHLLGIVRSGLVLTLSGALALGLLCEADAPLGRTWLYAGIIALSMGELSLGLNYLALDARLSGPFLLLCFYTLVGPGLQHLWQQLDRRTVVEYMLVAVAGLVGLGLLMS